MDDIEKAVVMSVQVLMFIFALTIATATYYKLNNNIKKVISETEFSSRSNSIYGDETEDAKRKIGRAEVITAILNMGKGGITKVSIVGLPFSFEDDPTIEGYIKYGAMSYNRNSFQLRNNVLFPLLPANAEYELSSFTRNSLEYRKVSP